MGKSRRRRKITFRKCFELYNFNFFVVDISSYYAKILGGKLFRTWEIPRSGSKAKDGEKKREREQKLVITMAKLRMAHASTHGARKPPGPKERRKKKERESESC